MVLNSSRACLSSLKYLDLLGHVLGHVLDYHVQVKEEKIAELHTLINGVDDARLKDMQVKGERSKSKVIS
jgi:hypothetical protein